MSELRLVVVSSDAGRVLPRSPWPLISDNLAVARSESVAERMPASATVGRAPAAPAGDVVVGGTPGGFAMSSPWGAPARLPQAVARRAAAFDLAVTALTRAQQQVLRLLLTGASVVLVAEAAAVDRYHIVHWLGDDLTYRAAVDALQHDLGPAMRARLHALVVSELARFNDDALDATGWATLVMLRAIGRLDTETNLLARSALRAERWKMTRP